MRMPRKTRCHGWASWETTQLKYISVYVGLTFRARLGRKKEGDLIYA